MFIVRFYVFLYYVSMRMYVFMPIHCCVFKTACVSGIVCVSETCILIFKVYLFVLYCLWINMCNKNCTVFLVFLDTNLFCVICETG